MKHIITFYNDISKYPPIISVITYLLSINAKVIVVGFCSDRNLINKIKSQGCDYYEVIENNNGDNFILKISKLFMYKMRVARLLKNENSDNITLWCFGDRNSWLLHSLVYRFNTIIYLFEIPSFKVLTRFRIFCPTLDWNKLMKAAHKIVCCEYNRAHIVQGYFGLSTLPLVIPNKPNINVRDLNNLKPDHRIDINLSKKIILYQGIFNYPERKLDELCESIDLLPVDFELVLMGDDSPYKLFLKRKYESKRVHFISHISFPNHLYITRKSYIGFLSYAPEKRNIENVLNTLYCAPNKVYEYAMCNIPILYIDNPALNLINNQYCIGRASKLTKESIAQNILAIDSSYNKYTEFTQDFINDTNLQQLYSELL